jgi:hypothetical protein
VSSDDYIFVLESPAECFCGHTEGLHQADCPVAWGTTEYRVKHVLGAYWENEDEMLAEFSKGDIPIFHDEGQALVAAHKLHDKESEVYPVEYGVSKIKSETPVPRGATV